MWKWVRICAALAAAGLVLPALAQEKPGKATEAFDDAAFVKKVAKNGLHEVKMGQLAKQRATDADVKRFADRLVEDHTKVNRELKTLAQQMGVTLPEAVDQEHQKHYDMLAAMSGREFDRAYVKHMIEGHEKSITAFNAAVRSGQDRRLVDFATKTLPTLKDHLEMAKRLDTKRQP